MNLEIGMSHFNFRECIYVLLIVYHFVVFMLLLERWPVQYEYRVLLLPEPLEQPVDGLDGRRLGSQRGEGGVQLEGLRGLQIKKREKYCEFFLEKYCSIFLCGVGARIELSNIP